MDCFQVDWKGFYSLDDAQNKPESREKGIYGVYKQNKVLYYIGESQEVGKRLSEHREAWARILSKSEMQSLSVCFGTIFSYEGSRPNLNITLKQLKDIESFFINTYKPEGNSEASKKGYKGIPLFVVNTGKINKLDKIICHNPDFIKLLKGCLLPKQAHKPKLSSALDW